MFPGLKNIKIKDLIPCLILLGAAAMLQAKEVQLYFRQDSYVRAVTRNTADAGWQNTSPEAKITALVHMLLQGPDAQEQNEGLKGILPSSTKLDKVTIQGTNVTLYFSADADYLKFSVINDLISDLVTEQLMDTIMQAGDFKGFSFLFKRFDDPAGYHSMDYYLPQPIYQSKPYEETSQPPIQLGGPPGYGQGQPSGALTGRTVFVSQSHGWYWTGSDWTTQRGVNCNIVEDFINAEAVNQYLLEYLWNAGTSVFAVRERDLNTSIVIVDNDGGNGSSTYQETGSWYNSTATGFANGHTPYQSGQDPFSFGTVRLANVNPTVSAQAIWTPYIPATGYYPVYISYVGYSGRATDAHFIVKHVGGQTDIYINQRLDGHTWKFIGEFYFEAGLNANKGQVILQNNSTNGSTVSADAVRFGGGFGEIYRGTGTSGKPKWEECCRYNAQLLGAPETVYNPIIPDPDTDDNDDDVTCRPLYAEWEKETGETALFISWHTNATTGGCTNTTSGTSTYVCLTANSTSCTDTEVESQVLQNYVHAEIINDIRAEWDSGWTDRGKLNANFGEMRALSTMPGVLIELAFHDSSVDTPYIKNPKFRQLTARAIYQAIVKYFGVNATLLPEPPTNLGVSNYSTGRPIVRWNAPPSGGAGGDPATGYRVYVSENGYAFGNAIATTNTSLELTGLTLNKVYYVKVSATNNGGESFPTETLAVRVTNGTPALLIVNGFDRIDGSMLIPKNDTIGQNMRMVLRHMNSYDYIVQFAQSVDAYGLNFDSASNEAVKAGYYNLLNYCAVLWISGEESSGDATFDATEQTLVQNYLTSGGNVFVSGAEIGWELDYLNYGRTFYRNYLKGLYRDDDPYTSDTPVNSVTGLSSTIFQGLNFTFDNGTGTTYNVDYPDVLDISGGSVLNLQYIGSSETYIGAGIQYSGTFKVVNIGFPFETINASTDRDTVMNRVLNFLTSTCTGSAPGEVPMKNGAGTPLRITKSGPSNLLLSWALPGSTCNISDYAIYRGTLNMPFAYNHSSFLCNTGNDLNETIPADSGSYYYLIVAWNSTYEGSYGRSSAGIERPAGTTSCKSSQNNNSC